MRNIAWDAVKEKLEELADNVRQYSLRMQALLIPSYREMFKCVLCWPSLSRKSCLWGNRDD